jgi:hypothetical protein
VWEHRRVQLHKQPSSRIVFETIAWDERARTPDGGLGAWTWRHTSQTPNGPITVKGTAETREDAVNALSVERSRLWASREWGHDAGPVLSVPDRRLRKRPRLRGPGIA